MTSPNPNLFPFLNHPILTVTTHAPHRRIDRSNLYVFIFFTAIFAVIIAHAR
jgi:hypothetical protein